MVGRRTGERLAGGSMHRGFTGLSIYPKSSLFRVTHFNCLALGNANDYNKACGLIAMRSRMPVFRLGKHLWVRQPREVCR
jgi:hypothetical protein